MIRYQSNPKKAEAPEEIAPEQIKTGIEKVLAYRQSLAEQLAIAERTADCLRNQIIGVDLVIEAFKDVDTP